MTRLYLFAEGQTEQTFADEVLKPHLANQGVYIHRAIQIAHARKKSKVHRGGGRNYLPMKNDIRRMLAQETAANVFFTTMIDLYGIHRNFPGLDEAAKLSHLPRKRVEFLEECFAKDIGDQRFIPYVQLHEFEAYLFADPTRFASFYDRAEREIAALQAIADSHDSPETIDDGQHTAPSKQIIVHFPDYEDAKPTIGPQIAKLIGLNVIRSKCPHLNAWLSSLERLGA